MRPDPPTRLVVGRIVRAHGLTGYALIQPLTDAPDRFKTGSRLGLGDPNGEVRQLTVAEAKESGDRLLVRFEELPRREDLDGARGELLSIPASEAAALPPGSYYPHQLEGLAVVDEAGASLGTLTAVLSAPAHDVWVIRSRGGEVLVPAVDEIIVGVDLEGGKVVLRPIEGLFE